MLKGGNGTWKQTEKSGQSILSKEIALNHRHEEILAKRELLMRNRESLMKNKADQVQVTLGDWHKAKERNEQILRELDKIHHSLQKAACTPDDATFVGMRDNYWKMVEQEHPVWLAQNKPRITLSKQSRKR